MQETNLEKASDQRIRVPNTPGVVLVPMARPRPFIIGAVFSSQCRWLHSAGCGVSVSPVMNFEKELQVLSAPVL